MRKISSLVLGALLGLAAVNGAPAADKVNSLPDCGPL